MFRVGVVALYSLLWIIVRCEEQEEIYNIPDPDCTGSFGTCTERDLAILGYDAIKKLHESMDDNHDGTIDLTETKGFIEDELNYKNDNMRRAKLHEKDTSITIDELWKLWIQSEIYKWKTDDLVDWLSNDLSLSKYKKNFQRNRIDGRFLPRLAVNDHSYLTKVMQVKDFRDRNKIIIKATDLILFGRESKYYLSWKDIIFVFLLGASSATCVFAYLNHLKSQKRIEALKKKFENINDKDNGSSVDIRDRDNLSVEESHEANDVLNELVEVKKEAERLKRSREGSVNHVQRLKFAERELEKVREALKQREMQIHLVRTQPPKEIRELLNSTYESEKALLDVRFEYIQKEKNKCLEELTRLTKSNESVLGMFRIAHSSALEEINIKLEMIQKQLRSFSLAKIEWSRRWNIIENLTSKQSDSGVEKTNSES